MRTIKLLSFLLLLSIGNVSNGQIDCQLITPPSINLSLEKASSFSIISGRNIEVKAVVSYSNKDGKCVELITRLIQLTPGAKVYNFSELANSIRYSQSAFEQYYTSMAEFMPGIYKVCIDFYCPNYPDCSGSISLGEERTNFCFDLESISPTPLLLFKPDDKDKLHTILPLFQWIPPMPIASKVNLQYKMKIVEMRLDQGAEDAIYRNRPIFESEMLSSTNHQYMNIYSLLEKGKTYAWMVDAYVSEKFLTNSEVWEFTIYDKPIPQLSAPEVKLKLNSEYSLALDNSISFSFYEKNQNIPSEILEYELINSMGEIVANYKTSPLPMKVPGMNFYTVDICDKWQILSGKYTLKLNNINSQIGYFQFDFQNNCN